MPGRFCAGGATFVFGAGAGEGTGGVPGRFCAGGAVFGEVVEGAVAAGGGDSGVGFGAGGGVDGDDCGGALVMVLGAAPPRV